MISVLRGSHPAHQNIRQNRVQSCLKWTIFKNNSWQWLNVPTSSYSSSPHSSPRSSLPPEPTFCFSGCLPDPHACTIVLVFPSSEWFWFDFCFALFPHWENVLVPLWGFFFVMNSFCCKSAVFWIWVLKSNSPVTSRWWSFWLSKNQFLWNRDGYFGFPRGVLDLCCNNNYVTCDMLIDEPINQIKIKENDIYTNLPSALVYFWNIWHHVS